jgi:hypothetical protein
MAYQGMAIQTLPIQGMALQALPVQVMHAQAMSLQAIAIEAMSHHHCTDGGDREALVLQVGGVRSHVVVTSLESLQQDPSYSNTYICTYTYI